MVPGDILLKLLVYIIHFLFLVICSMISFNMKGTITFLPFERYWIGMELPADAKDTLAKEEVVRCFRVWQSESLNRQMVSVQVQIWNGEIYTMSPVTDTGSLQELGGGVGIWWGWRVGW